MLIGRPSRGVVQPRQGQEEMHEGLAPHGEAGDDGLPDVLPAQVQRHVLGGVQHELRVELQINHVQLPGEGSRAATGGI